MVNQLIDKYDDTRYDEVSNQLQIKDGLTRSEREMAEWLLPYGRGVWMVTGIVGSGKNTIANTVAWWYKTYFEFTKVLLDYKPRRLFGEYEPFDPVVLLTEVTKMASKSVMTESGLKRIEAELTKLSEDIEKWLLSEQNILLQSAVLVLQELKMYVYNRKHTKLSELINKIATFWRHLDLLMIGCTPFANEIDIKAYWQHTTVFATCTASVSEAYAHYIEWGSKAMIAPSGVLRVSGEGETLKINGKEPRPRLGLWITPPGTDKALGNTYTTLSSFELSILQEYLDGQKYTIVDIQDRTGEDIDDIEDALKRLIKLNYLTGYGYYDLFNSKNMANLTPKVSRRAT